VRQVCGACTYTSIAAAISAANACDIIEIVQSTDEAVILNKNVAEIRGSNPNVLWTASANNITLEIRSGLTQPLRIHDLYLRHEAANNQPVVSWTSIGAGSSVRFDHLIVENASNQDGINVQPNLTTAGQLTVDHCIIRATGTATQGLELGNETGIGTALVYDNLFQRWNHAMDANHAATQQVLLFYNNTVDSAAQQGLRLQSRADVRNNVFTGNVNDVQLGGSGTYSDFSYNAFAQANAGINLATNLTGTVRASQYVSAGVDYHLLASSDLRNRGTTITAVADDLDGVSRPKESAYEIGAYEFDPVATPTPSPSNSPSQTPSFTASPTPSISATDTPSASPTGTPTVTLTASPSASPTATPTASQTGSPSPSPSNTPTQTPDLGADLKLLDRQGQVLIDLGTQTSFSGGITLQAPAGVWAPEDGALTITAGSLQWSWTGDLGNGEPAPNGLYELRLSLAGGSEQRVALWVKHAPRSAGLMAVPNPARGPVGLYWAPMPQGEAWLRVYNFSGELVIEFHAPASAGFQAWDLRSASGQDLAGGLYLVRLDLVSPSQRVRQTFKLAVAR
jgi:hypothetical protein